MQLQRKTKESVILCVQKSLFVDDEMICIVI